jgi:hypothetical protein
MATATGGGPVPVNCDAARMMPLMITRPTGEQHRDGYVCCRDNLPSVP